MKKHSISLLVLAGLLLLLGCKNKEETSPYSSQQALPTDMKKYVEVKCSMCHFSNQVFEKPRKPEEWMVLVPRMRSINRQLLTEEDVERILNYLITNKSITEK
jgi:PBP1b-binding outer membrane lipoprotein LpoB